jgi:hypothetical protein
MNQDEIIYKQKYLKYKNKYLELKKQLGGIYTREVAGSTVFLPGTDPLITAGISAVAAATTAAGTIASTAAYAPVNLKRMFTCPWTTSGKNDKRVQLVGWISNPIIKTDEKFANIIKRVKLDLSKLQDKTVLKGTKFLPSSVALYEIKQILQDMKSGADSTKLNLLNDIIGNLDCLCNERGVTFTGTTAQALQNWGILGDKNAGKVDLRCLVSIVEPDLAV